MRERRLTRASISLLALLGLSLALQIGLRAAAPRPSASAHELPQPPATVVMRLASFGEPFAMAQLMTLYLQSFDTQTGISIPFRKLDYERVESWLACILELDPASQYPLLLASQVYSQVPDEARQRRMLDFVYEQFRRDPITRWRWLAHASLVAKHRLHDLPLALAYAQALAQQASNPSVPSWARQMHIFLLEDLGEVQAAKILLGGLLASGAVTDASERRFLIQRLNAMESAENSTYTTNE